MLYGYARVSSNAQETALQMDALQRARIDRLFTEKRGGRKTRPALDAAISALRPGDSFLIWKVDRVARSLADLIVIERRISSAGASFVSLTEAFDTGTPAGRFMFHILGAAADYEWSIIRERSIAGQEAARARGARIGRPRALTPLQESTAVARIEQRESMTAIARDFGVHLSSVKRAWLRVHKPESPAVRMRKG
jgi:DNA invertase Pin-like site-specific DNA recombinase